MSTSAKYSDSSPVVVSPEPKRSSCSCVMAGCGCLIVVLLALVLGVRLMWPRIQQSAQQWMAKTEKQFGEQIETRAIARIQADSRVREKLGEPLTISSDPENPFTFREPQLHLNMEGPNGKATVVAQISGDEREFSQILVTFDDGTNIDLMQPPAGAAPPETEPDPPIDPDTDTEQPLTFHQPYFAAVQLARNDERVIERLGEPLRDEFIHGEIEPSRSDWRFQLHGPMGQARAVASAASDGKTWTLIRLEVTFADDQVIEVVVEPSQQPVESPP